jgi:fatty-acyl-CoA synthase
VTATLQGRLAAQWAADPERRRLGFVDRRGRIEGWDAPTLREQTGARARWMHLAGLGAGQVAVVVTADPKFAAVCVLAALELGAVPLLVAPPAIQGVNSNLGRVLGHVVGLAEARLALLPPAMAADGEALSSRGVSVLFGDAPADVPRVALPAVDPDPDRIALLQLTSGTTGLPRICTWHHRQVLAAIDGMAEGMALGPDDRFVNWTPLYHDMGLINNFLLCLVRGLDLVLMDPFHFVGDPALWLRTLHAVGATQTWSPNFGYALAAQRVTDASMEGVRLDGMRGFWNAGEKVHHATFVAFHERFAGHGLRWSALKANFGCAENVGGATFTAPDGELVVERVRAETLREDGVAEVVDASFDGRAETVVSTGRGHPRLDVRILGNDGSVLGDGRVGRIALASPSRMVGFLGEPERSGEVLGEDHVLTGDLGYLRAGELFWVGRDREQINLSGVKFDPSDFEDAINAVEGVRKGCFAAFGVEDERLGSQRLVVLCEVQDGVEVDQAGVCTAIRAGIALGLGVSVFEVHLTPKGQLTKTSSGKRRHLHFRDAFLRGAVEIVYSDRA